MLYQKIKILVNVWHVYIMRSWTFALCCSMIIFNSKIKFKKTFTQVAGTGWFVVIKSRKIWLKDNQNHLSRPSNWHLVDTRLDMSGSIAHNQIDYNTTSHYYTQPVGPIRHWLYINTFIKKKVIGIFLNFFYFLNMSCSHFLGN